MVARIEYETSGTIRATMTQPLLARGVATRVTGPSNCGPPCPAWSSAHGWVSCAGAQPPSCVGAVSAGGCAARDGVVEKLANGLAGSGGAGAGVGADGAARGSSANTGGGAGGGGGKDGGAGSSTTGRGTAPNTSSLACSSGVKMLSRSSAAGNLKADSDGGGDGGDPGSGTGGAVAAG